MYREEVAKFVQAAIECSYLLAPKQPGLTLEELVQVGAQLGFKRGEVEDNLGHRPRANDSAPIRFGLDDGATGVLEDFLWPIENDQRDPRAFDFVRRELDGIAREVGFAGAALARTTLVHRGMAKGIDETALEAAVTILRLTEFISIDETGVVRPAHGKGLYPLALDQVRNRSRHEPIVRRWPRPTIEAVRDVIERRSATLPASRDPVAALEHELVALGYPQFRVWWAQQVSELAILGDAQTPTAVTVLCAALCEGALVFVVDRAQALGLTLTSRSIERGKHSSWKFDDLAGSAQRGTDPVLDADTYNRVHRLNGLRQRIHAGRLIAEPGRMTYDARPEEAAFARETLSLVARRVVDWVRRNPARSDA